MTYRTAMIAVYDVLDTVFVSATVTEYNGTPGVVEPVKFVLASSLPSKGEDDGEQWLLDALSYLVCDHMTEPRRSGETAGPVDGVTSR